MKCQRCGYQGYKWEGRTLEEPTGAEATNSLSLPGKVYIIEAQVCDGCADKMRVLGWS